MKDEEQELVALRPSVRPFVTAIALNALVALGFIGFPYLRGRARAEHAARAVVALAACLLDGSVTSELGLAPSPDERERFAALYARADPSWPARCRPRLEALRPEPAIFLLPSPKAAERDLREASGRLESALDALEAQRAGGSGQAPEAPLEALSLVRGIALELLRANDVGVSPEAIGLAFREDAPRLAAPSRIPLRTGAGSLAIESGRAPLLRAIAADELGVAEVRVFAPSDAAPAHLTISQLRRPSGARGVITSFENPWLAWTTSDTACDADAHRCALRATGLGRLLEGARVLRPEYWLASHPEGAIERALWIDDARFTIVARAGEASPALRVIPRGEPLPAPAPNEPPAPPSPVHATAERALEHALDWIPFDAGAFVLEASEQGRAVRRVSLLDGEAADVVLPALSDSLALERCGERVVAIGATHAQVLADAEAWPVLEHRARSPARGASADDASVRLACDADTLAMGALDAGGALTLFRCTRAACEHEPWPLEHVEAFDVAVRDGRVWVATSGGERDRSIHVARAFAASSPTLAAACWSSSHGFCGPPRWAEARREDGERPLILAARDGTDLLALVVGRDGALEPLPGLAPSR